MNKKEYFDQIAEKWDNRPNTEKEKSFAEKLVKSLKIKEGQKILDVGTGTGILIPQISKLIGSTGYMKAVDFSEGMVNICKAKFGDLANLSIDVADIEEISLPSSFFDYAICFGVFPHLQNKSKALGQLNRVLKSGGTLIIAHALSSKEIERIHACSSPMVAHDMLPASHVMESMLVQAGFGQIQITDVPGCYMCTSTKL